MSEDDETTTRKRPLSPPSTTNSKHSSSDQTVANTIDDRAKKTKTDREDEGQESPKKNGRQYIKTPHLHDVLCGRGGGTNNHAGNEQFRILVHGKKRVYLNSSKREKPLVSKSIVDEIRNMNPPGRFLSKCESTQMWYDIGDQKAREKTSQALREGAPEIRRELGVGDNGGSTSMKNYSKQIEISDNQHLKSDFGNMSTPMDGTSSGPITGRGARHSVPWQEWRTPIQNGNPSSSAASSSDVPLHFNSMHHREHNVGANAGSVQSAAFLSSKQQSHLSGPNHGPVHQHRQFMQQQKVPPNQSVGRKESSVGPTPAPSPHLMSWSSSEQLHNPPQPYQPLMRHRTSRLSTVHPTSGHRVFSDHQSNFPHSGPIPYMSRMRMQRQPPLYPIERNPRVVSEHTVPHAPNDDFSYWPNPNQNSIFDDPPEIEKKVTSSENKNKQSEAKQSSITVTGSIEVGKRITFKNPSSVDFIETTEPKTDSKSKPSNHCNQSSPVIKTKDNPSVFDDAQTTYESPKLETGLEYRLSIDDYITRLKVEGRNEMKAKKWDNKVNMYKQAGLLGINPDEMSENMKKGTSIKDVISKTKHAFNGNVEHNLKFSLIAEELKANDSSLLGSKEVKLKLFQNETPSTKLIRNVTKDNPSEKILHIEPKQFKGRRVTSDMGWVTHDPKTNKFNFSTGKICDTLFYLQINASCTDIQNKVIHALQNMGVALSESCSSK